MTSGLITLTGSNFFALKKELNLLMDGYGPNAIERLEADELTAAQFSEIMASASLFAPERIVILNNPGSNSEIFNLVPDLEIPEGTKVVLFEPILDARTKTYKFLKSSADFRQFNPIEGSQLTAWIIEEVKKLQGQISPEAVSYLIKKAGIDQWRLALEIDKLVSLNPVISTDTVDQLVEPSLEGTAFELLDAAFVGDRKKVSRIIDVLKNNEDPHKLIGLIASQVYALAILVAAGNRTQSDVASDSGIHPFVIRKLGFAASKLGLARLRSLVNRVADIDVKLKTSSADPWLAVEVLLSEF